MKFPKVSGSNLLRRKVILPADLQGSVNILFIAFQQRHQALIDAWVPRVSQLVQSIPDVQFYEIPVIQKLNFISQTFINEGMRAGIPNHTTREKTITLYLDKMEFRRILEIPHEETIWVLVLDREGNVLWRTEGAYSVDKGDRLQKWVQDFLR